MRILKTDIDLALQTDSGFIVVEMPDDGTPLRLAHQDSPFGEGLKLWFITERPDGYEGIAHYLAFIMTGQEFVPVEWNYLSSVEIDGGIIAHVFYVPADKITQEDKTITSLDVDNNLTDGETNESEVPED